jgi:hypothetical protein
VNDRASCVKVENKARKQSAKTRESRKGARVQEGAVANTKPLVQPESSEPSSPKKSETEKQSGPRPLAENSRNWWPRYGLIAAITASYFLVIASVLLYKYDHLLFDWPFDEAYAIQQFHNWNSGYPNVTIQPGDLRSGFPGDKPFEEKHKKWIYEFYKVAYRAWPRPETIIVTYALLVSLSVATFYLFLTRLGLAPWKITALLFCWMLYPLQQKIAVYSYCDPLTMCGTFYFFYLYLLCADSRYSFIGALMLLLPREEACLLILPTFLLLPRKWKTLLWQFACLLPFLVFAKHGTGNPFAYTAASFHSWFLASFWLTETIFWVLALIYRRALFIGLAFMVGMICVGGEIYFRFPYEYQGEWYSPPGGFYYYGLVMPALMAAVALGVAALRPTQIWLTRISLGLLLVPGTLYAACQLRYLAEPGDEAKEITRFKTTSVPADAAVVTDMGLSSQFANRDQLYVYTIRSTNFSLPEMFARARFAFIRKDHSADIQSDFLSRSPPPWHRVLQTSGYDVFEKD